jgi:hypothetical protein
MRTRRETDAEGRTIRQWDANGQLVYSIRQNAALEYKQAFTDAPRRGRGPRDRYASDQIPEDDGKPQGLGLGFGRRERGAA